jgi:hypothetical protein
MEQHCIQVVQIVQAMDLVDMAGMLQIGVEEEHRALLLGMIGHYTG